jgi:hypothetical protein
LRSCSSDPVAGTGIPVGYAFPAGTGRKKMSPVSSSGDGDGDGKLSPRGDGDGEVILDGEFPVAIFNPGPLLC